jgi:hypothetical protein
MKTMQIKKLFGLIIIILAVYFSILEDVNATAMRVTCELRSGKRSKISVDGYGLSGKYYARAYSGGVWSRPSRILTANSSHQAEFDFDSDPGDIREGATAIPANFIKGGKIVGSIRRYGTNALIGSMAAACRIR